VRKASPDHGDSRDRSLFRLPGHATAIKRLARLHRCP
jgi:hypothetical protein